MGINIVAIFPVDQFEVATFIHKIEEKKYSSIKEYYNTVLANGFPEFTIQNLQWYIDDEKTTTQKPTIINNKSSVRLPEGLVIRFKKYGIEVWSPIRANLAIKTNPEICKKLLVIYKELGKDFISNQCWIMGDDNPIYHSFSENENFKLFEEKSAQVEKLEDLYKKVTVDNYTSYEIKGHYILTLKS